MNVFKEELKLLINKHNVECGSNKPYFIIAEYLMACLSALNQTTRSTQHPPAQTMPESEQGSPEGP